MHFPYNSDDVSIVYVQAYDWQYYLSVEIWPFVLFFSYLGTVLSVVLS